MEVLLLLYSVLHVRLYASVLLGLLFSVLFEAFGWLPFLQKGYNNTEEDTLRWLGPGKALLHMCAHVIGIHLFIIPRGGESPERTYDPLCDASTVADELMKQGDDEGVSGENSGKRYSSGACSASAVSVGEQEVQQDYNHKVP
ncbi:hypothetical protein WMY93_006536 [Mugilogobius chulae]|uniref:Uncharacterized protein n=1 Tax=Mugilogobius chulae TaxID=88201 RepID=A0AAW0PMS1_9GOBI